MIVRLGISAICALAAFAALVLAAPVLAQPRDHGNSATTFRTTSAPGCPGFFTVSTPTVEGWSGRWHGAWIFVDPLYSDVTLSIKGTWTDPTTGLGYRIHFDGGFADPMIDLYAVGDVTIWRSDGLTLSGRAEYIGQEAEIALTNYTCS
jgi:hypothetical protein